MNQVLHQIKDNPLLQAVFNNVSCGIVLVDKERNILALNSVFERTLGISSRSLLGKKIGELLGCVHLKGRVALEKCCLENECQECEIRKAALYAITYNKPYQGNAAIVVSVKNVTHHISFQLKAVPFSFAGERYAVVLLQNFTKLKALKQNLEHFAGIDSIIGEHQTIIDLKELIKEVAQYDFPVVIQGESGTGKELVALAIHQESRRANQMFVPVNCAAIPHGLLESELFGHVKGAFTGALKDKKGRFELADGGTIFLDEIGDLDFNIQAKLLRVLQEGSFERLGSTETTRVDVRVISATNKDLQDEVEAGRFRLDLYYRLCVAPVMLPSLRERKSDIPLLAKYFVDYFAKAEDGQVPKISKGAMEILKGHSWRGNVRELQNVIQFSLMKSKGKIIKKEHLPSYITKQSESSYTSYSRTKKLTKKKVLQALEKAKGNKQQAARELGVARSTLYRFLKNLK